MAEIKIDGEEYIIENLSDEAKNNLNSLQYVKSEIQNLEAKIAIYKTAEIGYAKALKENLDGQGKSESN